MPGRGSERVLGANGGSALAARDLQSNLEGLGHANDRRLAQWPGVRGGVFLGLPSCSIKRFLLLIRSSDLRFRSPVCWRDEPASYLIAPASSSKQIQVSSSPPPKSKAEAEAEGRLPSGAKGRCGSRESETGSGSSLAGDERPIRAIQVRLSTLEGAQRTFFIDTRRLQWSRAAARELHARGGGGQQRAQWDPSHGPRPPLTRSGH